MTIRSRAFGAVAASTAAATLTAALAGAAPAQAAGHDAAVGHERPGGASALERSLPWQVVDESVDTSAAAVVADAAPRAGENARLGVVSVVERDGVPRVVVEQVRGRTEAIAAVAEAQDAEGVLAVSLDTVVRAADTPLDPLATGSDPLRSQQWALPRLSADKAWSKASGAGAVVAVIDTGVDGAHPDLANRLIPGIDYVTGSGDGRTDENGHGTHVAGIIAALRDNAMGVAGFASDARIMPIRVLDANGSGKGSDVAKAIVYAANQGADVINLSLGGPSSDAATQTAVNYALSQGVIVVAAVGNERTRANATTYPAAYDGVVGVASTEQSDSSSSFSNTGDYVDVAAPGGKILSTYPSDRYAFMSGTSMATPYTAATAALAVDLTNGGVTPQRFADLLNGTADDLGATGWDKEFGHGIIDPNGLLAALAATPAQRTPATTPEPSPAPAPAPAPAPSPAPSPTPEPQPDREPVQPTPAPTPDPAPERAQPAPAKKKLELRFTRPGGTAYRGQSKVVRLHVEDANTGKALPQHRVQVVVRRGGEVVKRRWVTTNRFGNVGTRFRMFQTSRFVLRSPATDTTQWARSDGGIRWRVVGRS